MNTLLNFPYSFSDITSKYTRTKNPNLYHFIGLCFGKKYFGYYFIAYSYMKWIDDFIDIHNENLSKKKLIEFVIRQENILEGKQLPTVREENLGSILAALIVEDKTNFLKGSLQKVIKSFYLDIERKYSPPQTSEFLKQRIELIGTGILEFSEFAIAGKSIIDKNLKEKMVSLYILTDMLLDFDEDVAVGYINISQEDICNYTIPEIDYLIENNPKVHSIQFKKWMSDKAEIQFNLAKDITKEIEKLKPSFFYIFLKRILEQRVRKIQKIFTLYKN